MKPFLCACLLFSIFYSYAQQIDERLLYAGKVEKYKRMKTAGTVLTVAGSIAMIVVAVRVNNNADYSQVEEEDYTTTLTAIAGVSALGAGVPLWIIGAHNQQKYKQKLKEISVGININSQGRGLTLTYHF